MKIKILSKKQTGMSLIELLISMVAGLFLMVGLVSNFISNKTVDVKREAVSSMDANAAEAFRFLRHSISHAGYKSIENVRLEDDNPFYVKKRGVTSVSCGSGKERDLFPVKSKRRTRDGAFKDHLTVISMADNPCLSGSGSTCVENPNALVYTDCAGGGDKKLLHSVACSTDPDVGMAIPSDAKIYSSFWLIRNNRSPENRTLMCGGNRSRSLPIANDVEAIQYLYGVKNDVGEINYRTADQINATNPSQWPMVVSVQIGLLMRSSNQFVFSKPNRKTTYSLLNEKITINRNDARRLFRVYTTTVNLENRNLGPL